MSTRRNDPSRSIRAPRGSQLSCKSWLSEAAFRMLQNNLDPDVAENPATGQQFMLLAQSYMPAQSIHVLRNVQAPKLGAWFAVPGPEQAEFETPEWTFERQELGRF